MSALGLGLKQPGVCEYWGYKGLRRDKGREMGERRRLGKN